MKETKNILARMARFLDLPGDVMAGLPRVELIGTGVCAVEPHKGLLQYDPTCITIATRVGALEISGSELTIEAMNRARLTVRGEVKSVVWRNMDHG